MKDPNYYDSMPAIDRHGREIIDTQTIKKLYSEHSFPFNYWQIPICK